MEKNTLAASTGGAISDPGGAKAAPIKKDSNNTGKVQNTLSQQIINDNKHL